MTTKAGKKKSRKLSVVHAKAAGIDIGAQFHVVAVPAELCDEPVQSFKSFTHELNRLVDWLEGLGITTVAMESTGVYWIPLYEMLTGRGIETVLVNARHAKGVPGRKTDVNDAQWLQQLHSYGLLRGSFHPDRAIAVLRTYVRQRERLLEYAASHIQHMQKALNQMNLQLQHVVEKITGVTGMAIIRDIIAGERDPDRLARHRDVRCKQSVETIRAALVGHYLPEHLFSLRQAVELYDFYQQQIAACDREIEQAINALPKPAVPPVEPLPKAKHRSRGTNEPAFDIRAALYAVIGVDVTQLYGMGPSLALSLVSECGTDMTRWPSAKHFTSWLCLSPGNKISGGKVLSSRTRPSSSRAAALLRLAATTLARSDSAMGAFYRRLGARIGKSKAVTATARKIAVLFYNTLRYGMKYVDPGSSYYEERYKERTLANLRRRAKTFGFELQPCCQEPTPVGVS